MGMTLPIKRKLTILQGATFRKRWTWKPGGVPMDFTGCKAAQREQGRARKPNGVTQFSW